MGLRRSRPTLITVILPAFDAAATLSEQLAALVAQDYGGDWEVVVADNGSRDGTVEIASMWTDRLPELRVIDASARRGPGYARNRGAHSARGDYLAFCDTDDVVGPGWLTAHADAATDADLITGIFDEESLNDEVVRSWIGTPPDDGKVRKYLGFLPFARGSNFGIHATVFDELGGFDESYFYGDDAVLCWRAQLQGFSFAVARDAVVAYRFRTSIRALARQAYVAGQTDVQLYRDFRAYGLRRPALRRSAKGWAWLLIRLPSAVVSRRSRGRWARGLGYRLGRAVGTARYRVFAP